LPSQPSAVLAPSSRGLAPSPMRRSRPSALAKQRAAKPQLPPAPPVRRPHCRSFLPSLATSRRLSLSPVSVSTTSAQTTVTEAGPTATVCRGRMAGPGPASPDTITRPGGLVTTTYVLETASAPYDPNEAVATSVNNQSAQSSVRGRPPRNRRPLTAQPLDAHLHRGSLRGKGKSALVLGRSPGELHAPRGGGPPPPFPGEGSEQYAAAGV
jgi:hypothetical protein